LRQPAKDSAQREDTHSVTVFLVLPDDSSKKENFDCPEGKRQVS